MIPVSVKELHYREFFFNLCHALENNNNNITALIGDKPQLQQEIVLVFFFFFGFMYISLKVNPSPLMCVY